MSQTYFFSGREFFPFPSHQRQLIPGDGTLRFFFHFSMTLGGPGNQEQSLQTQKQKKRQKHQDAGDFHQGFKPRSIQGVHFHALFGIGNPLPFQ